MNCIWHQKLNLGFVSQGGNKERALSEECDKLGSPSMCPTAATRLEFSSEWPLFKRHNPKSSPWVQSPLGTSRSYVCNIEAHHSPLHHLASATLTFLLFLEQAKPTLASGPLNSCFLFLECSPSIVFGSLSHLFRPLLKVLLYHLSP